MSEVSYYTSGRHDRNIESKAWATRDGQPWSPEEEKELVEYWNGHDEALLAETSEVLERTIEACRQRYYEIHARGIRTVMVEFKVSVTRDTPTCPNCHMVDTIRGGTCLYCGDDN